MIVKVKLPKAVKARLLMKKRSLEILQGKKNINEVPFDVRSSQGGYYTYAFRYNRSICNHTEYMKVWELLCSDMQQKHTQDQAKTLFFLYQRYRELINVPTSNGTCPPE